MGKLEELRKKRGQLNGKDPLDGMWAYNDDAVERFPFLFALLSQTKCEGKHRETATIILFAESGRLKFSINDRDDKQVGFGSLDSLEGALDALEAMLAEDKVDWRPQKDKR